MERGTILKRADCDLKRLAIGTLGGPLGAFVLSQVDGRMTLEDIAEIAGAEFAQVARIADKLIDLGAVAVASDAATHPGRFSKTSPRTKSPAFGVTEQDARPLRADPRSDDRFVTRAGAHLARAEKRSLRPDPRADRPSVGPTESKSPETPRSLARPPRTRTSRKSLRMQRPASSANVRKASRANDADETCEIDEATYATIMALDAKLGGLDHYTLLAVERAAEKKAIKRAYFALAATFHPDRFFGKKLGRARLPLERIFVRVTEAHDVLSNPARRSEYDATLPPAPPPRKASRALKAASRQMQAAKRLTPSPAPSPAKPKTERPAPMAARPKTEPPGPAPSPAKPKTERPAPMPPPRRSEGRMRRLHAAAREVGTQAHVEVFLRAAEEALKVDDVIGAANNYRLALQNREDPYIRKKFEDLDELAKTRRFERSNGRGTVAEKDERWAEAAEHLSKAHAARPGAAIAARAAHAIRMSRGDLRRAAELAEQAVALEAENAAYRTTLGEIYLSANVVARAADESAIALELAPNDPRAKALAAAIVRVKKR